MHLLIVGSGSVGKRHARNFRTLGCSISAFDPRPDRNAELAAEGATVATFVTLGEALAASRYDGAIICSPPHVHVDQTLACMRHRLPILLEKPVSPQLAEAQTLHAAQRAGGPAVLLGYTWRWWPPLGRVRGLLSDGIIGSLRHVRFVMSAHLADWHPWEPYQEFFMARRELGGGALLDESHWIDIACWLFGEPFTVSARVEKISDLEISSDDNVDILLTYPDNLRVSIHLDLYGRPHEKSITFVGDGGTIRWTAEPNQLQVGRESTQWQAPEMFSCERNDMFVGVAREFLEVIGGRAPSCTLRDGIAALRVVEAARLSHESARTVTLGEVQA